ncbi:conserved hypothetical protein [Uncinocarpus reesii 1704]|uniref:Aminotransferase class I/classII large domain-containing protein n=1 Tax=Uncinocarpus reesii (strain UAMH 1704) TaxID=336963 RepID=C4JM67_UNCRE|nr:uncharacterized protein UREG_03925 [Uncinocarpus reesii 1704]EEP79079.1 conserved hypothetical protein [Uncinocarpus reesii 1704]
MAPMPTEPPLPGSHDSDDLNRRRTAEPMLRPPHDFSRYYSCATRRRVASSVKDFYKYFAIPGIHNLAGGLPHVSYFPFDSLEATVALPNRIPKDGFVPQPQPTASPASPPASQRVVVPKESSVDDGLRRIDLATALQYGAVDGYPPLRSFIRQFVRENLHPHVPYEGGPEVILTCGATDGFSKTIEAFTNVWDENRDWIRERQGLLCEEFAYMTAIQTARPRGLNIVPVAVDSQGMKVEGERGLADVLDNWDFSRGQRPHLMYTVTIGQNPTGAVLPLERRRQIYKLCQRYDIIIIEDDPYWHLQYPSAKQNALRQGQSDSSPHTPFSVHDEPSGFPFLDSLVKSYLSIDTAGRVVRLDTFSKIIAPGCRLGWLTAQPDIVERILRISETSTQQPSGFVQSMVAKLIMGDQADDMVKKPCTEGSPGWRVDGWVRWLEGLRGGYEKRMQTMCTILEEGRFSIVQGDALSNDSNLDEWQVVDNVQMFDFDWPGAGMFVWVKFCLETHPLWSQVPAAKLANALWKYLINAPYRVIVGPGWLFAPTEDVKKYAWRYMRLCFAPVDEGAVATSSHNFIEGCRSFWQVKDIHDIDDLEDDNEE